MPLRLRHAHEPRLEDRQEHVRREAPVAETHHPGARCRPAPCTTCPCAPSPPGSPSRAATSATHRDPVGDQRDVEDEQADGREPEGALGEAVARQRPADDPRQRVPAEPGRDQRAAADDHHVRVREVADEVARRSPARASQSAVHGRFFSTMCSAAEHEEEPAGDEVLRESAVVRVQLFVAGTAPSRTGGAPPGQERGRSPRPRPRRRRRRSGTRATRGAGRTWSRPASAGRARGSRRSASRRGRGRSGSRG